jgi:tRNA (guanine10-N2)-dimethyltransferase
VAFDAPYGRKSKVVGDRDGLVRGALAEARRVAPRAVVVADRDVTDGARAAGWRVVARHERRVHRSLVRHVHVLTRD